MPFIMPLRLSWQSARRESPDLEDALRFRARRAGGFRLLGETLPICPFASIASAILPATPV
jgi:hypothetical protein